jgi:hypothetical protein
MVVHDESRNDGHTGTVFCKGWFRGSGTLRLQPFSICLLSKGQYINGCLNGITIYICLINSIYSLCTSRTSFYLCMHQPLACTSTGTSVTKQIPKIGRSPLPIARAAWSIVVCAVVGSPGEEETVVWLLRRCGKASPMTLSSTPRDVKQRI